MFDNPTPEEFEDEIESLIDDETLEELHNGDLEEED